MRLLLNLIPILLFSSCIDKENTDFSSTLIVPVEAEITDFDTLRMALESTDALQGSNYSFLPSENYLYFYQEEKN